MPKGDGLPPVSFAKEGRMRLRAAGLNRREAREESWEAMLEKSPPQDEQAPVRQSAVDLDRWSEADATDTESKLEDHTLDAEIAEELKQLARLTNSHPTCFDRNIDFAYRNMALPSVTPLMAPGLAAWQWYLYSRREPIKFLEISAKREEAKAKQAGKITSQRMEDDKRKQFAILDRIASGVTVIVSETVGELMQKFPEDVLLECRKHTEAWKAFFEKYPESND